MLLSYFNFNFNGAYAHEALVLSFTPWTLLCCILRYSLPSFLLIFIFILNLFASSSFLWHLLFLFSFLLPHPHVLSLFFFLIFIFLILFSSSSFSSLYYLLIFILFLSSTSPTHTPHSSLLFHSIHIFLSQPVGHISSPFQKQPSDYLHSNKSSTLALPSTSSSAYTPAYTPAYASVYGGQ